MANNGRDRSTMWLILVALFCILFLGVCVSLCAVEADAAEPVTVVIRDFGKGMTPGLPPYRNAPEDIILSENFFSVMPTGRQVRYGVSDIIPLDSITTEISGSIDAIAALTTNADSASIVMMADGEWFHSYWSIRDRSRIQEHIDTPQGVRAILPYNPGTCSTVATQRKVLGAGTRFCRDLLPGDSIVLSGTAERFEVSNVLSDTVLFVRQDGLPDSSRSSAYTTWRGYPDSSNTLPYLMQSGDFMYTGSRFQSPQIIYNKSNSLYLRGLGIVDSFLIDTMYYKYPAAPDTTLRQSWRLFGSNDDTLVEEFAIVSRTKAWGVGRWFETTGESPVTYYVRIGYHTNDAWDQGKFFQIRANDDTALYLWSWWVDSTWGAGGDGWLDSVFLGHGTEVGNFPAATATDGRWAYIYSAAGTRETIWESATTDTLNVLGRGSAFYWVDTTTEKYGDRVVSPYTFYDGLYFIHITDLNLEVGAYTDTSFNVHTQTFAVGFNQEKLRSRAHAGLLEQMANYVASLPAGESVLDQGIRAEPGRDGYVGIWRGWVKHTVLDGHKIYQASANNLSDQYFPIRYAEWDGDTLFFISQFAPDPLDRAKPKTASWEIVRAGIPSWSGMTEWGNPPQLVSWGDTAAPTVLSFSTANRPWDWTANQDVNVGSDPDDPVMGCIGFNDQLVVGRDHSMLSFNGIAFSELSQTDGLVGPRAITGDNKKIVWLDHDGLQDMRRRDFSGYTITKISAALNPVFNSWDESVYGTDIVPFKMNPAKKHLSVLTKNHRDDHFYLFFPEDTNTVNRNCLTFTQDGEGYRFDGYFNIAASDAFWGKIRDTSRIVISSPDTGRVAGLDYVFSDYGSTSIASRLRSAKFFISDKGGWPMNVKLSRARLVARGSDIILPTRYLIISASEGVGQTAVASKRDSVLMDLTSTNSDAQFTWRPSDDIVGLYWQWEISVEGSSTIALFQPYELRLEFIPVGEDK